jgi:hypothetical protein
MKLRPRSPGDWTRGLLTGIPVGYLIYLLTYRWR